MLKGKEQGGEEGYPKVRFKVGMMTTGEQALDDAFNGRGRTEPPRNTRLPIKPGGSVDSADPNKTEERKTNG